RCISNFPQLHPSACRDFGAVHLDFVEIAARRMNHHGTDSTIADKKIRSAAHYEKRQVLIAAKPNQLRKGVLTLGLDPKLRRAAYAQRRVFRKRLVKTDVAFAHDRLQLFRDHQIRRQNRQLFVDVASAETQHDIAATEGIADIPIDALEPWLITGSTMTAFNDFINYRLPADAGTREVARGVTSRHNHAIRDVSVTTMQGAK